MKRIFFICIFFIFCVSSWAENVSIYLSYDYAGDRAEDYRSVSILPAASHDGNTISIHSSIYIENLGIVVKDKDGNVVYSEVTRIPAGQTYSFLLNGVAGEEYTIELAYGDRFLYGNFEL